MTGVTEFVHPPGGNFHLSPQSDAIDVGTEAAVYLDIDGQPRPFGTGFDIGADEFIPVERFYLPLVFR